MKESYREGPASRPDPESCADGRKAVGEALTGAHTGQPLSCVIHSSGVPTPWTYAEGNIVSRAQGESLAAPIRRAGSIQSSQYRQFRRGHKRYIQQQHR